VLHAFETSAGAAATSGIGRRSWRDGAGRPAHHLLDPSTGRPAYTGLVQATAFASTAAFAEICAKAALLSGPDAAAAWLPCGGVLVRDDGSHQVVGEPVTA
jgi:thiamine biosynthesis lipoprotein